MSRITETLSDEDLLLAVQYGYGEGMGVLFERYSPLVCSIGWRLLKDLGEAEDLRQDVFLEVFRHPSHFDPNRGTVKAWILTLAYYRALDRRRYLRVRRLDRQSTHDYPDLENLEIRYSPSAPAELTDGEYRMILKKGMESLTENQQRTFSLVIFEGLTIAEAADRMGVSEGQAAHFFYRGRDKLQAALMR